MVGAELLLLIAAAAAAAAHAAYNGFDALFIISSRLVNEANEFCVCV